MNLFASAKALELARRTPPDRDRYVDFLRVFSILTVVLGHFIMAVVYYEDGKFDDTNALVGVPVLRYLTWVLQVMPLFFIVGGFSHAIVLKKARERGQGYAEFIYSRAKRLTHPVVVYLSTWVVVAAVLYFSDLNAVNRRLITRLSTQLLWFIGAYLIVVAMAPLMYRLHRRNPHGTAALIFLAIALVDLLRFGAGSYTSGFGNFLFVWLAIHQLGYLLHDGEFAEWSPWQGLQLTALCLFGIWMMVQFGPYPTSMVGLPGERISNMNPPNLMITTLGVGQLGLLIAAQGRMRRVLARPAAWARVITIGSVIMTIFLWHLTAMIIAYSVLLPLGVPQPEVGTPAFWAMKVFWTVMGLVLLIPLVAVFGRFERISVLRPATRTSSLPLSIAGILLLTLGLLGTAVTGLAGVGSEGTARFVFMPANPVLNLLHVWIGLVLLSRGSGRTWRPSFIIYAVVLALVAMLVVPWANSLDGIRSFAAMSRASSGFAAIALLALGWSLIEPVLRAQLSGGD